MLPCGEGSCGEGSRGEGSRGEGSRINVPQLCPLCQAFSRRLEKEGSRSFCDPLLLRAIMRAQGVSFVYERVSEGRVSVEKGAAKGLATKGLAAKGLAAKGLAAKGSYKSGVSVYLCWSCQ